MFTYSTRKSWRLPLRHPILVIETRGNLWIFIVKFRPDDLEIQRRQDAMKIVLSFVSTCSSLTDFLNINDYTHNE